MYRDGVTGVEPRWSAEQGCCESLLPLVYWAEQQKKVLKKDLNLQCL